MNNLWGTHNGHQYHVGHFIICSKFLPDFYGLDNADLQNNYAIEVMKWVIFLSRLKNSQHMF